MGKNKTQPTRRSVSAFIRAIKDPATRADCTALDKMMRAATREKPVLWGSIVGYGSYHYKSERSSQEGDWFLAGFSPRAQALTIYVMAGFDPFPALMKKLGKYKTGKSCLYVRRLSDVHLPTLRALITRSTAQMRRTWTKHK